MNPPRTHATMGEHWPHRWNPYASRERATHRLADSYFRAGLSNAQFECDLNLHMGCLDAPDEIPMGSTLCVHTVAGFDREAYNLQRRGCEDWRAVMRAKRAAARMIREILREAEASEADEADEADEEAGAAPGDVN